MKKCIVTVLGKDTVGIIAKVCTYLAENEINILDISQTIVQGYFNMMMIVDVANLKKDFKRAHADVLRRVSAKARRRACQNELIDHFALQQRDIKIRHGEQKVADDGHGQPHAVLTDALPEPLPRRK